MGCLGLLGRNDSGLMSSDLNCFVIDAKMIWNFVCIRSVQRALSMPAKDEMYLSYKKFNIKNIKLDGLEYLIHSSMIPLGSLGGSFSC